MAMAKGYCRAVGKEDPRGNSPHAPFCSGLPSGERAGGEPVRRSQAEQAALARSQKRESESSGDFLAATLREMDLQGEWGQGTW